MFFDRTSRVIAAGLFVASVWASVGITVARAQQTQSPDIRAFIADPGQLLRQYPNGGRLSIVVQQVALADPASFKALMDLLPNANDIQKGALGEGLAQAAKILVLTDQPLAAEWQKQIAAVTDPTFKTAAINAFGDVQLGAVGGGPLGATGGGGGQAGGGGNGSPPPNAPTAVVTPSFTFSSGTTAGSAFNTPGNIAGNPPGNTPGGTPGITPFNTPGGPVSQ